MMNVSLQQYIRATRHVAVAHSEAFQLMLYQADDGAEAWFWNSRDGVTPFCTWIGEKEFRHAIRGYPTLYSAVLPDKAEFVWVSYDEASWVDMVSRRWVKMAQHPKTEFHDPEEFRQRYPAPAALIAIDPLKLGSPRQITRAQFLESTNEWMRKYAGPRL